MPLQQAHENMLKQQVRTEGVVEEELLKLLTEIPRENFVSSQHATIAYADTALPVGAGQFMMPPSEIARMLKLLTITSKDKVLLVGIESGYIAALLAKLAEHVEVVDGNPELMAAAEKKLHALNIKNINFNVGDATSGWNKGAPYDVVVISGSLPQLPLAFRDNLQKQGRIFAILGNPPVMTATLIKKNTDQAWSVEKVFETNRARLVGAKEPETFLF